MPFVPQYNKSELQKRINTLYKRDTYKIIGKTNNTKDVTRQ
jgi:hypothetical protein